MSFSRVSTFFVSASSATTRASLEMLETGTGDYRQPWCEAAHRALPHAKDYDAFSAAIKYW